MQRYFLQLSYNGKNYNGWQVQKNTANTIQQVIQDVLRKSLSVNELSIIGCGRTDTGVHAEDFYAHFDSEKIDLHQSPKDYLFKLNKMLPEDISIHKILPVKEKTNARFDAISRVYEYRISRTKNSFLHDFSWYIFGDLSFEKMAKASQIILNNTDFSSFAKSNDQPHDNNCIIKEAKIFIREDGVWIFKIEANRFLRNMVRAIVGTIVNIGKGKIAVEDLQTIIDNKNRKSAGMSAPAQGLFLTKVNYDNKIFMDLNNGY